MTSTTMQIECPACAGQGGAGTYCEDCDCTGMVYVPECVADELATVRKLADMAQAALAAMTQRAEQAEALPTITWIPVSDQLPPPELRVLAVHNDGRMTMIIRALYIPRFAVVEDYDADIESDYDPDSELGYYPAGWYEAVENSEYAFIGPLTGTVTHWAKLPKLPAQEVQP